MSPAPVLPIPLHAAQAAVRALELAVYSAWLVALVNSRSLAGLLARAWGLRGSAQEPPAILLISIRLVAGTIVAGYFATEVLRAGGRL